MPPQLVCLKAMSAVRTAVPFPSAAFSMSARAFADAPSQSERLRNIAESTPQSPSSITLPVFSRQSRSQGYPQRKVIQPGNDHANDRLQHMIERAPRRVSNVQRPDTLTSEDMKRHVLSKDLTKQIARRWKTGDVYAPHDLSPVEMEKWKKRSRPEHDIFDMIDLDPLPEYKNFSIMSEYMTPMGRIMHSSETGLRPVNQRRIARAIRRSIGMGLMPSVHRHPEILQAEAIRRRDQLSRLSARNPVM